jgi:hypothetical protein
MAQRSVPHISAPSEAPESALGDYSAAQPLAELPVERSRFSRLLARFGLGELTDPILRPTKHPAERAHPGRELVR